MTMGYPDHQTYERLYARYFASRAPQELLAHANDFRGRRVLDLCAGNCRASVAAIEMGAREVMAIDQQFEMLPKQPPLGVSTHNMDVWRAVCYCRSQMEDLIEGCEWEPFGLVICQQAINYWLRHCPSVIQILATLMWPDATFVFNTFNRKPPSRPTVKEYEFEGRQYVEMSWLTPDNRVHHVQAMEGMEPHVTSFDWISQREFRKFLSPHFNVVEKQLGNTSIYTCTKKVAYDTVHHRGA